MDTSNGALDEVLLLFVWDFDHTIVDVNTDTAVFKNLAPDVLSSDILGPSRNREKSWTTLMNIGLEKLARRGVTPERILETVSESHLPACTKEAIELVQSVRHARSVIASDANSLFIDAVLSRYDLRDAFAGGIHTNPAALEVVENVCRKDGYGQEAGKAHRIAISPYIETTPKATHFCSTCPANMCKGEIVERLLDKYRSATIVYVGDGRNDFCPSKRLPGESIVLARGGYSLDKLLQRTTVSAQVVRWQTSEELLEGVTRILGNHRNRE